MPGLNLLYVMCDQLRRDALGCYGGPVPTPRLDRLAAEGMRFDRAYSLTPMCTPARAVMMTGRFTHALQDTQGQPCWFNDRLLDLDETTYAKELTAAGYRCSYIGKWHNDNGQYGAFVPRGPRRQGFEGLWAGLSPGCPNTHPFYFSDDGQKIDQGEDRWVVDAQVELAGRELREAQSRGTPSCLVVSFGPPHRSYEMPATHAHLLEAARSHLSALPPNVPAKLHDEAMQEAVQYYANVLGIDAAVGRLLDELEDAGLAENTAVMFTADHGEALYSHGLLGKNQCYEEAAGVPLIFRGPGVRGGAVSGALVNQTDLAPTLLALAGLTPPARMQGRSLQPLLRGEAPCFAQNQALIAINHPWYDWMFNQGPQGHRRGLVTGDWKLVLTETPGGVSRVVPTALYRRDEDPWEMNNLVDDPACRPQINRLAKEALRWMAWTEDPFFDAMFEGLRPQVIRQRREAFAAEYDPGCCPAG